MSDTIRWDERYAKGDTPWETGQPSSELQRVVAEMSVRPCRAVELDDRFTSSPPVKIFSGCRGVADAAAVQTDSEHDRTRHVPGAAVGVSG